MWLRSTIILTCAMGTPAVAQEIHAPHCLHGCPSGSPATNDLIFREIYILSSNDLTKFADWVAYKITRKTIGSKDDRNWKVDPDLADDETLESDDYEDANRVLGTQRGHQVPLASFTGTEHWLTTNYLSNITPQQAALNNGVWKVLENAERALAISDDVEAVFVMTGTLYEHNMEPLPKADEAHMVPSGYWKIVAIESDGDMEIAAFIFEQDTPSGSDLCDAHFIKTVAEVETRTGLAFFHALPPDKRAVVTHDPPTLLPRIGCRS